MRRAFSYNDLLVSIGIAAILVTLVTAIMSRTRTAAQSMTCMSRLRSIGHAFTQFAADNGNRYPDPTALGQSWEKCIVANVPNQRVFQCPSDSEVYPVVGSSYDWRDTGLTATTLAGRALTDVSRMNAVLSFETLPGWHYKGKMNALLVDSSVRTMEQEECLSDLQSSIRAAAN